jgi:hypothetical protein
MGRWRNGRRTTFRSLRPQGHEGSNPSLPTHYEMNKSVILQRTKDHLKKKFAAEGTGHDWWHIERVLNNATAIAKREKGADLFIVQLGALLHDIADWKFHGGDDKAGNRASRSRPLRAARWPRRESAATACSSNTKNEIVVIDVGLQFPEDETPGIDYIIPNVQYSRKEKAECRKHHFDARPLRPHRRACRTCSPSSAIPRSTQRQSRKRSSKSAQDDFPNAPKMNIIRWSRTATT